MEKSFKQLEQIKHFLNDTAALKSKDEPVLHSIYQEYLAGIKFSVIIFLTNYLIIFFQHSNN